MRFALVAILIAAAMLAGCEPKQQYRTIGYSAPPDVDPIGPQAYQDEYPVYDRTQPEIVGPLPDEYDTAGGGATVADTLGISTAEQRRRELEAIDRGAGLGSTAPDPVRPDPVVTRPVGSTFDYTVARGDTLWALSRKFLGKGSRWREIQAANPGIDPAKIMPGQTLLIPAD